MNALRATFRTLDFVAPPASARIAARLWCTMPTSYNRNGSTRPRDDRPIPGLFSPPSTVATIRTRHGQQFVTESWGEGDPVFLVHGWGGWRGQLGEFVEPVVARGYRAVAIDAPSHGESPPGAMGHGRSHAGEFADALLAAAASHGAPAAVIAHSLGAMATAVAIGDGLKTARTVLIAPAVDPIARTRDMAHILGLSERTRRRLIDRLERLVGRPMSDFNMLTMEQRTPALVLHDRDDREVPNAEIDRLAEAWPDLDIVFTEGLGHRRILRDPHVVNQAVEFATRPAA